MRPIVTPSNRASTMVFVHTDIHVAEPIAVLVLPQLANEFGAVGVQAGKDVLDVVDGEHDATYAQRVRRCVRLGGGGRRGVELRQLKLAVAVRGPHECDVDSDADRGGLRHYYTHPCTVVALLP